MLYFNKDFKQILFGLLTHGNIQRLSLLGKRVFVQSALFLIHGHFSYLKTSLYTLLKETEREKKTESEQELIGLH